MSLLRKFVYYKNGLFSKKTSQYQKQEKLDYILINLVDHCNLGCMGCDHFAGLAKKRFEEYVQIVKDLNNIKRITGRDNLEINLEGGETLLHPELEKIVTKTREIFPNGSIKIYTNGIKIKSLDQSVLDTLSKCDSQLIITRYPVNTDYNLVEKILKDNNIKYEFYGPVVKKLHKTPLDIEGKQNPKFNFANCFYANKLFYIKTGKLYPCTFISNINHFNNKFNTDIKYTNKDYLILDDIKNEDEILEFVSSYKPICRYCNTKNMSFGIPWQRTKKDISEWT